MSRRTSGTILLLISGILYATRYVSAAIFGSSFTSWSTNIFNSLLQYLGKGLISWSTAALIVGIIYLVWAEIEALRSK